MSSYSKCNNSCTHSIHWDRFHTQTNKITFLSALTCITIPRTSHTTFYSSNRTTKHSGTYRIAFFGFAIVLVTLCYNWTRSLFHISWKLSVSVYAALQLNHAYFAVTAAKTLPILPFDKYWALNASFGYQVTYSNRYQSNGTHRPMCLSFLQLSRFGTLACEYTFHWYLRSIFKAFTYTFVSIHLNFIELQFADWLPT